MNYILRVLKDKFRNLYVYIVWKFINFFILILSILLNIILYNLQKKKLINLKYYLKLSNINCLNKKYGKIDIFINK